MLRLIVAAAVAASAIAATPAAAQDRDDRYYQGGGGGYPGGGYPGGGNGYGRPQVVSCESQNFARQRCPVDTRGGVTLVRQRSQTACVQGRTWGYDPGGIWVRGGCVADFAVGRRGPDYGGGFPPAQVPGAGYGRVIACSSRNYQPARCPIDIYNGARLVQDISGSCNRKAWGWDRGGIWVNNGCRGRFEVF